MIPRPIAGVRQLISGADALSLAQFSSFPQPDLSEPALGPNENEDEDGD